MDRTDDTYPGRCLWSWSLYVCLCCLFFCRKPVSLARANNLDLMSVEHAEVRFQAKQTRELPRELAWRPAAAIAIAIYVTDVQTNPANLSVHPMHESKRGSIYGTIGAIANSRNALRESSFFLSGSHLSFTNVNRVIFWESSFFLAFYLSPM